MERDDLDLLRAWRSGDADAGDELLRRHFLAVYRFLANKLDRDVDDVVQRVFLALAQAGDGEIASFRAYLLAVARHELYRHLRTVMRERDIDWSVSSIEANAATPSALVALQGERRLLIRALRRIPLELQIALELHYWEQLTTAELATVLGVPQGTAKSRLRRAREALELAICELEGADASTGRTTHDLDEWLRSLREEIDHRHRRA